jgi:hypothetical protein
MAGMTKVRHRLRALALGFWALVFIGIAFQIKFEPPYVETVAMQLALLGIAVFLAIHAIRNWKTVASN